MSVYIYIYIFMQYNYKYLNETNILSYHNIQHPKSNRNYKEYSWFWSIPGHPMSGPLGRSRWWKRLVLRKISKGWSSNRIESTCSLFRSGVVYLRRIGKTIPTYAMFFVRSGLQWIIFSRVGNVVSAQDAMLYWKNDKDKANPFRVIEPIPFDKHGGTWALSTVVFQILGPHDSPGLPRTSGKGRLICFCRVFVCFLLKHLV